LINLVIKTTPENMLCKQSRECGSDLKSKISSVTGYVQMAVEC